MQHVRCACAETKTGQISNENMRRTEKQEEMMSTIRESALLYGCSGQWWGITDSTGAVRGSLEEADGTARNIRRGIGRQGSTWVLVLQLAHHQ